MSMSGQGVGDKMSIYQKHPWIIPIVPFIILFIIVHGIISYFLTMLCPIKVWTSFNRFGSKIASWIPKVEVVREFTHMGFNCLVHKKKSGSLYGRVVLPKEHPYYGKGPWELPDSLYQLGRFTYGTPFQGEDQWYVEIATSEMYVRYEAKDPIDFVTSKTKQLAEQLAIKSQPANEREKPKYVERARVLEKPIN